MARVYLAESLASGIGKLVVLKVLNRELASEPEMRVAFRREAELSARLNHPNVVQVFEVVQYGGIPVIVMEYLDGIPLSRILQHLQLPLRLHLYAIAQVLSGLHHFHELKDFEGASLNAVHRDVSPQNVVVLHEGSVKVVDFGIAKVNSNPDHQTRAGMIKGKIHYMPPEQLLGEASIDRRADIFAVGVMLWEAIAGRRMWEGSAEGGVVRALANGSLPRLRDAAPKVPQDLERICEKALAIDRKERYATAEEMQIELEQAFHQRQGYVQPRELAEFMSAHFGDRRQFQRRTVESALRSPATSISQVMECVTPISMEMEVARSASAIELDLESSSSQSLPLLGTPSAPRILVETPKSRGWLWIGALVVSILLAGGAWFLIRSPEAAPQVEQAFVELEVVAHPPSAEIFVDGSSIGIGRVRYKFPRSQQSSTVEVSLAGYLTERRKIFLRGDTSLEVSLREAAAPPLEAKPTPQSDAPTSQSPAVSLTRKRAQADRRGARPTSAVNAAAPAAPATVVTAPIRNCSPPYRLSADGVKTFKPECF